MSILTTVLGAAATVGGIGVYRALDNRTPNGSGVGTSKKSDKGKQDDKKEKKAKKSIPPVASTAISSAALALTGTANQIYSKHRMNEIKSEWTTSVSPEGKVECSEKLIESLTDEELVVALQAHGLLEEDTQKNVKTI